MLEQRLVIISLIKTVIFYI